MFKRWVLMSAAIAMLVTWVASSTAPAAAGPRQRQSTRTLYLRNQDPNGCAGGTGFLSDVDAVDEGNGCTDPLRSLSQIGELDYITDEAYRSNASEMKAIRIDSTRQYVNASIAIASATPNHNYVRVGLTLNGVDLGSQSIEGLYAETSLTTPPHPEELKFIIPKELHGAVVKDVVVTISWYGSFGVTWVELDNPASKIEIPSLSPRNK